MMKGYRDIIFAVLGLLFLCAAQNPPSVAQTGQPKADARLGDALSNIAATYVQQAKEEESSPLNRKCDPDNELRDSDLCAQWKAADAAADSAWWAWASGWASIFSLFGVFVALSFAYQANRIARDTAKRQLRAYVFPRGLESEWGVTLPTGERVVYLRVVFRNVGATPVRELRFVLGSDFELSPEKQFLIVCPEIGNQKSLLGPEEEIRTHAVVISQADVDDVYKAIKPLYIYGAAFYRDVFDEADRVTRFSWQISIAKSKDAEFPDQFRWCYIGSHNCADEECDSF